MSKIISGVPVQMTISFNEFNGQVSFTTTKDLEFPVVVQIFCQLLVQFVQDGIRRQNAAARPPDNSPPAA